METKTTSIMKTWIVISLCLLTVSGLQGQTLDDHLAEAAENNPGLKARYAEFEAAMQRSAQAAQMPNPTLSFGYFIRPVETRVGPQQAKVGLSQMFPWFGTLKSRSDAATFLAEARYYDFIDTRESLYASVKRAYYILYENHRLVKIEEDNLRILETLKELSLNKYESGKGTMADVYRADVMIDESETQLHILEEQIPTLRVGFNALLNRPTYENVILTDSLARPAITVAGDGTQDFSNHPMQRSVAEMQQAAVASEQAAKRAGYPSIGLGLDYVFVGQRSDMAVPDNGKDAIVPMVSVSLPIYRKSYKAARTEAQKMQESYAGQSQELDNMLESKLEQAMFSRFEAYSNYELLGRQIAKTEIIIELLLTQYSSDELDFEVLLREQQKLLHYKKNQVQALVKEYISLAHIAYLKTETNENK
jgi:cobalt-zinc-cadmium efflux system outer membrane protein